MMWERNSHYKGWLCLVCGLKTKDLCAPMGIASGSFPCCKEHEDRAIMIAYFRWCEQQHQTAEA